jgi:hypothetical protein
MLNGQQLLEAWAAGDVEATRDSPVERKVEACVLSRNSKVDLLKLVKAVKSSPISSCNFSVPR